MIQLIENALLYLTELHVLCSTYDSVKCEVKIDNIFSEQFDCTTGLRQSCILNLLLFSLYINELVNKLYIRGDRGTQLYPDLMDLLILLFTDDIILFSDTIFGLENHLNTLKSYCDKWQLSVKSDKTHSKMWIFEIWRGRSRNCIKIQIYFGVIFTLHQNIQNKLNQLMQILSRENMHFNL